MIVELLLKLVAAITKTENSRKRVQAHEVKRAVKRLNNRSVTGYITMYDSIEVEQIPSKPQAVAGYKGGRWPTFELLLVKFPRAKHLSIAVNATENADCLDVEIGDATPQDVPEWVKRQIQRGIRRPCVYANLSTMPAVITQLQLHGLRNRVRLWVAHYTHLPHIPSGYDACQWSDKAYGRNLDISMCKEDFFDD